MRPVNARKHPEQAALFALLREQMHVAPITEAFITAKDAHIEGFCDGGSKHVTINPQPPIVLAILHELLHRMKPRWSERRVDRESQAVLCCMNDREIRAFYRLYQERKYARKSTLNIDAEAS